MTPFAEGALTEAKKAWSKTLAITRTCRHTPSAKKRMAKDLSLMDIKADTIHSEDTVGRVVLFCQLMNPHERRHIYSSRQYEEMAVASCERFNTSS